MPRIYKPKIAALPERYYKGVLSKLDGRTELKRRLQFTYGRVIDDAGGAEALPHVKLCLVERFAWLEEFLRQIESKLAEGVESQGELLGKWVQGVNAMQGLAKLLGVSDRQPRDFIDVALYAPDPADDPETSPGKPPGFAPAATDGEAKGETPNGPGRPPKPSVAEEEETDDPV